MRLVGYTHPDLGDAGDQARALEVWSARHGHTLIGVQAGHGPDRGGMAACLASVVSGRAEGILLPELAVLGDIVLQEAILRALWRRGASVLAVDEYDGKVLRGEIEDPRRVLVNEVLSRAGKVEKAAKHIARLSEGHVRTDRHRTQHHPYGWRWNTYSQEYEVDPLEGQIIMWMMEMRDAGMGYGTIAKALNEAGVPSRKGGEWAPFSVQYLLRRDNGPLVEKMADTYEPEDVV